MDYETYKATFIKWYGDGEYSYKKHKYFFTVENIEEAVKYFIELTKYQERTSGVVVSKSLKDITHIPNFKSKEAQIIETCSLAPGNEWF